MGRGFETGARRREGTAVWSPAHALGAGLASPVGVMALQVAREAADLKEASAVDERFGAAFSSLGFTTYSIIRLVRVADGVVSTVSFGRRRRDWDARYDQRNYASVDPVIAEMARSTDPFFWSEIKARRGALARDQQDYFEDARRYGFYEGYAWPLHRSDGSVAGVTLAGEPTDAADPDLRAALHLLSIHYEAATRRLRTMVEPVPSHRPRPLLRRRQTECLQWASAGKTSEEIGMVLSLSPKTVDEHLGKAYRALNVCTRPQAIARALTLGLISPGHPGNLGSTAAGSI